jgi:hypothetical protein
LEQDDLVDKLASEPSAAPPDVTMLDGFLGKSPREGFWRLYLTPQLNEHVEVAEGDIVHRESRATEQDPLRGTRLWIRRQAVLQHSRTESRQVQAEMLSGSIATQFLPLAHGPSALATARAGMQLGPVTLPIICKSQEKYFDCTVNIPELHISNEVKCEEPKPCTIASKFT